MEWNACVVRVDYFAGLLQPTFWSILCIVLLFSWVALVPFVRAEFLKVRNLDYIKAAKMLGLAIHALCCTIFCQMP